MPDAARQRRRGQRIDAAAPGSDRRAIANVLMYQRNSCYYCTVTRGL